MPTIPTSLDLADASDTGTSNSDNLTRDTSPVITGVGIAGETITITSDIDGVLGTTVVPVGGTWTFTADGLAEGAHSITATADDGTNPQSNASAPLTFTIDTTAPNAAVVTGVVSDTDSGADDGTTSDGTLTINGTAEPDSIVTVFVNGVALAGPVTADGTTGEWSYDYTGTDLTEGNYTITASATDEAGNTTGGFNLVIDQTGPSAPEITGISEDTGTSDSDGITSDQTPTISGTGDPHTTITVTMNGNPFGTTTVDGGGNWSIEHTGSNIPDGPLAFVATATDQADNTSAPSTTFNVTLDSIAPGAPSITDVTDDNGSVADDAVTSDTTLTIVGTATANSEVEISLGGNVIDTVTADGSGDWSLDYTGTTLSEGAQVFTAIEIDAAGNRSGASTDYTVTVDTTAPAVPEITGVSQGTGDTTVDGVTADATPTVSGTGDAGSSIVVTITSALPSTLNLTPVTVGVDGTWSVTVSDPQALLDGDYTITAVASDDAGNASSASAPFALEIDIEASAAPTILAVSQGDDDAAADGTTSDNTPTISGNGGVEGDTITVTDQTDAVLGTATVLADGTWSFDYAGTALADGPYTLTATATDPAGNVSADSSDFALVIDTTADAAPVITGVTDDDGAVADDAITGDNTLTITGTAAAGSEVEVSLGGNVIGTVTATGGNWSLDYTGTTLTDGSQVFTAVAIDAAGNRSDASTDYTVTVDTTAPEDPAITGVSQGAGDSTVDGVTADATPTVSGTGDAGSSIVVTITSALPSTLSLDPVTVGVDGTWSVTVPDPQALLDGDYTIIAVASDDAGNASSASAPFALEIDIEASAAPTILAVSQGDDDAAADGTTSDNTPTISGNGGVEGDTITVTDQTDAVLGTATVLADGTWSFDYAGPPLADGAFTLTATATDPAGNVSADSSDFALVIDTTADAAPVITGVTDDNGPVADDATTSDNTLTISGTAAAGSEVEVSLGGNVIGTVTATGGNWSLDYTGTTLTDGSQVFTAVAIDAAGNRSDASTDYTVTVDTTAPADLAITAISTDTGTNTSDGITNDNTPTVSGTAETGSMVTVTLTPVIPGPATTLGPITAADGTWSLSYTGMGLPDGSYNVTVSAVDAAGNVTDPMPPMTLEIDTSAPALSEPVLTSTLIDAGNPTLTADATPEFTFTAEAGSSVEIDYGDDEGFVSANVTGTGSPQSVSKPTPYTTEGVKNIQVRVTDAAGNVTTTSVLPITINFAVTDLEVTNSKVEFNATAGTVVGIVSATDASPDETHTYSLVGGAADDRFILDGANIIVNAASAHPPLVVGDSYTVTVRAEDSAGNTYQDDVVITVEPEQVVGNTDTSDDGAGDGEVTGTFTDDTIDAGAGDDTVSTGAGEDDVTLGDGADTIKDTLSNLNGDTVQDFGEDDEFVFTDGDFDADDVEVAPDGQSITITSGGEETTINLGQELSGGSLLVFEKGGETVVSYEQDLITLEEGSSIDTNGANGIVSQSYLTGDGDNDYRITLDADASGAFAKNLLGVYEIAADGSIGAVNLVFADTSGSVDLQENILNVSDGAQLGFFLVANGAGLVTDPDADVFTFSGAGATANTSDGADLDLLINGTVVTNNVFHSFSPDLNGDGIQHAVSGAANNGIQVGFEDLWGGGDRDYQDVVFSVELFNSVPV